MCMPRKTLCCWILLLGFVDFSFGAEVTTVNDLPVNEALRLGERIYRGGILPDGSPVRAIVAGDVRVDGRMFTCVNCHQRSGLGSVEGSNIAWPINGKELFVPRRRTGAWSPAAEGHGPGAAERWSLPKQYQTSNARPAYSNKSLARAIRLGVTPEGGGLGRGMPRYVLDNNDMDLLILYLKNLSNKQDPGVDEKILRFATIITDDVNEEDRKAMLDVLQAHIDARNTQTRPHQRRATGGPFYKTEHYGAYRKLALDVWELKGPLETWREQLDSYYRTQPVFALLGGISSGSWAPIHKFSEDNKIPNIFPVANRPVVSENDWYTLYFSKGFYQEGEAAARFLQSSGKLGKDSRIVQVFRSGGVGETFAHGFQDSWTRYGGTSLKNLQLEADEHLADNWWRQFDDTDSSPPVILLWLDVNEVTDALRSGLTKQSGVEMLFVSGSMIEKRVAVIPEGIRDIVYLTQPHSLSSDNKYKHMALRRWLKVHNIPLTNLEIQSKMYFLGWMLPAAIDHMRGEFYRDYFMEGFDMMSDQDYAAAVYPRLSFGPGQRYASKGCYIVQISAGDNPEIKKVSHWVIN